MKIARAIACLLVAAVGVVAQDLPTDPQTDLRRAERDKRLREAEVQHLLDLRIRHDLGIGGTNDEVDSLYRLDAPPSSDQLTRMQQEFNDADALRSQTLLEYNKLHKAVEQLLADAEARSKRSQEQPYVVVPVAGSAQGRQRPEPSSNRTMPIETAPPPAPSGETAPTHREPSPMVDNLAADPLRAQIHGSENHALVAQALFKAGQAMMDRAASLRDQGKNDLAKEFDERGRDRLLRTLDELAPVLADKQPPFEALFCLGRCRELLFRYSERAEGLSLANSTRDFQRREQEVRDAYLAITVRDVKRNGTRGEVEVLGAWGQAAQAAMEHFRWINLHGNYDATARIEALTWPGEKEK